MTKVKFNAKKLTIFSIAFSIMFYLIGCENILNNKMQNEETKKNLYNGDIDLIMEETYSYYDGGTNGGTKVELKQFDNSQQQIISESAEANKEDISQALTKNYYSSTGNLDSTSHVNDDGIKVSEIKSYKSKNNGDSFIRIDYLKDRPQEILSKYISTGKYDKKGNYSIEIITDEEGTEIYKYENLYDSLDNLIQRTTYKNDKLYEIIKYKIVYKDKNKDDRETIMREYRSKVNALIPKTY